MTQLICLIQAANLKDGRRIGENQPFETDEVEAEILVRGGIARAAPVKPAAFTNVNSDPAPEPVKEAVPATVVEEPAPVPVSEPSPKKIISKRKR